MARMSDLLGQVKQIEEGFASDAQRRAAFASGYKAKGKKGKKDKKEEVDESTKEYAKSMEKMADKAKKDQLTSKDLDTLAKLVQLMQKQKKEEVEEVEEIEEALDKKDEPKLKQIVKKLKKASDAHAGQAADLEKAMSESKMKELATKIADIYMKMRRDSTMKPFADKFRADVKKSLDIRKSLEKVLPDYISGAKITSLMREEVELDETMEDEFGEIKASTSREARMMDAAVDALHRLVTSKGSITSLGGHAFTIAQSFKDIKPRALEKAYISKHGMPEETKSDVEVVEGYFSETKSSTGYELFHKDFSSAMRHAYDHAKRKLGVTIDPDEIDDKVAMGPRKPSKGKTNSYRLMGVDKSGKPKGIQIQVYNMGSRFELNMYKESIDEEVELDERMKYTHVAVDKKGLVIGFASDEKDAKDMARRNDGKVVKLKKPMSDKKGDMMINRPFKEEVELDEAGSQGMFIVIQGPGDNNQKAISMHKRKSDAIKARDMWNKKNGDSVKKGKGGKPIPAHLARVYEVGKFATTNGKPKTFKVGDNVTYTDFSRSIVKEAFDPADFDIKATSKDKEEADQNILIQLQKVISLRGMKPVKFADGSSQKVNPNVAAAALSMHRKLKRTDEKDSFQRKIGSSYRDLLSAVKGRK